MKKVDLIDKLGARDRLECHIYDRWFWWKEDQIGREAALEKDPVSFYMDWQEKVMIFRFEDGTKETCPLTQFYDDEDEQPDLTMLWHNGYYDGPLSGVAEYNGNKVYFDCIEEVDETGARIYGLYELSPEDIEYEEHWHNLFRDMVGCHTDYGDKYAKFQGWRASCDEYYALSKKNGVKHDFTQNKLLATVHWCQFKRDRKTVE